MRLPKLVAVAALPAFLAAATAVLARGGDPDQTFGTNGTVALRTASDNVAYRMATAADGTTVAVRMASTTIDVQRFLATGRPDPSWGTNGTATLPAQITVLAVMVQANGRVMLGGTLTSGPGWGFARLTQGGNLDPTFADAGWSLLSGTGPAAAFGMALHQQDDARIVAVAYPIDGATFGHTAVLRLTTDGRLDTTYGVNGVVDPAFAFSWTGHPVAAERVLGDGATELSRPAAASIAVGRLRGDGTSDSTRSFAVPFSLADENAPLLASQPDGALVVATLGFDSASQRSVLKVARFSSRGTLDQALGVQGIATVKLAPSTLGGVFATPDGQWVAIVAPQAGTGFQVVKLGLDNLHLDTRFASAGTLAVTTFAEDAAAMGPDGFLTVLVQSNGGQHDGGLLRLQAVGDIVEFHNAVLDHYFIALDGAEAAGIDAGNAGPGWSRTHAAFTPGGVAPVCRFYGTPGIGPNSHFYTAQPAECALVKQDPGWTLEGTGFYATRIVSGGCAAPLVAVHRLYNNGFAQGIDSNHRYVTELGLINLMQSQGWIYEGIVFCARP